MTLIGTEALRTPISRRSVAPMDRDSAPDTPQKPRRFPPVAAFALANNLNPSVQNVDSLSQPRDCDYHSTANMDGFHDLIRNQALLSSACNQQSASSAGTSAAPEKRYRCMTCGQGFSRAEHLKRHQTRRMSPVNRF